MQEVKQADRTVLKEEAEAPLSPLNLILLGQADSTFKKVSSNGQEKAF